MWNQLPSLVEARRAKYFSKGGSKSKQQRDEETMAKLLAFRGKIHDSVAPKNSTASSIHGTTQDDSLASRMARRAQQEEAERQRQEDDENGTEAYSGQVLDSDDGEGDDGTTWLKTKFKCRKHMDHLAGDGRNVDDYVVVDDTKRKSSSHHKRDRRR
jgi:hypothetical protein